MNVIIIEHFSSTGELIRVFIFIVLWRILGNRSAKLVTRLFANKLLKRVSCRDVWVTLQSLWMWCDGCMNCSSRCWQMSGLIWSSLVLLPLDNLYGLDAKPLSNVDLFDTVHCPSRGAFTTKYRVIWCSDVYLYRLVYCPAEGRWLFLLIIYDKFAFLHEHLSSVWMGITLINLCICYSLRKEDYCIFFTSAMP